MVRQPMGTSSAGRPWLSLAVGRNSTVVSTNSLLYGSCGYKFCKSVRASEQTAGDAR